MLVLSFLFFNQKTAYEMRISDWSSDVCSSDLLDRRMRLLVEHGHPESMLRKHALEYDCDLTVIGAFRRGLAFHLLVGGTTRRIVQVAPSDVLVVRASEQADDGKKKPSGA